MKAETILAAAPKCPAEWAAALEKAMPAFDINTPARESMFIAQCAHESAGFTRFVENLNYSAHRLLEVFPKYFRNLYEANYCARNPEALANEVYGGRMGNGPPGTGDGWRFRGRGCIQLTGRAQYEAAGAALRLPLLTFPDEVAQAPTGSVVAAWYWRKNGCNRHADNGCFMAVTRAINGGLHGYEDRLRWWVRIREVLNGTD